MTLTRFEDWPARLERYLRISARRPFDWAQHNCCLFATSGVAVITGVNPADLFDQDFTDRQTAGDALRAFAGGGVLETAQKIGRALDCPEVPVLSARRGDVVYTSSAPHGGLGLVDLDGRFAVFLTRGEGLARIKLAACDRAWKVG